MGKSQASSTRTWTGTACAWREDDKGACIVLDEGAEMHAQLRCVVHVPRHLRAETVKQTLLITFQIGPWQLHQSQRHVVECESIAFVM